MPLVTTKDESDEHEQVLKLSTNVKGVVVRMEFRSTTGELDYHKAYTAFHNAVNSLN